MDFGFGDDVDAFRHEVRRELSAEMAKGLTVDPTDLTGLSEETERRLLRWAGRKGWLALSLPTRYGGGGRPPVWQAAFNLEAARLDAPLVDTAVTLAGQPLLAYGTEAQRTELLPAMAAGEVIFCIAYTEQDAGSDLAAVSTRAEPDGPGFVLTGSKVHVTGAHKADWCCTVARTRPDGPARDCLSMFLVPMSAPGVHVVRRPTMNGWTLDEIRFDEVRLGEEALLGTRDGGWGQLLSAVGTEAGGMFHVGFAHHALEALADTLADRSGTEAYGRLCVELAAAGRLAMRALRSGHPTDAAAAKIYATELLQRIAAQAPELSAEGTVVRPLFTGQAGRLGWEYLERVHGTIGAGTNEMKRAMVARRLERTPRPDASELVASARASGRSSESVQRAVLAAALCRSIGATRLLGERVAGCLGDHRSLTPLGDIELGTDGRLCGTARLVPGADGATVLLVVARAGDTPVVATVGADEVRIEPVPTLGDDARADVVVDGVPVTTFHPLHDLPAVIDRVRLALAAEMAGAAEAAFESAVERSRTRVQFGRPIGEFQAVAHRLADAAIDLATVDDAVSDAAGALDRGRGDATFLVAAAKALANEACRRVTATAHQVWGAEGIYADRPLHRWHRRVQALSCDMGTTAALHRLVGAAALGGVAPHD